jgi:hypothetical protein
MIKYLFGFLLFVFFSAPLTAQNLEYRNVISGGLGFSLVGASIDVFDGNDIGEFDFEIENFVDISGAFTGRSTPALQVNYDYGIAKWFSIGGGISFQQLELNIRDLTYTDNELGAIERIASLNMETSRINITARVLFHYANNDKLDLYSGFRLGVTNWLTTANASDAAFEADLENDIPFFGVVPTGQLIPFAMRIYFNENLGVNFETGIGAPHFLAIGVNYRL